MMQRTMIMFFAVPILAVLLSETVIAAQTRSTSRSLKANECLSNCCTHKKNEPLTTRTSHVIAAAMKKKPMAMPLSACASSRKQTIVPATACSSRRQQIVPATPHCPSNRRQECNEMKNYHCARDRGNYHVTTVIEQITITKTRTYSVQKQ